MNSERIDSVEPDIFFLNDEVTVNKHMDSKINAKNNKIVTCFYCKAEMEVQEKIIIFDSNWFHSYCWEKFNIENLEKNTNKINI